MSAEYEKKLESLVLLADKLIPKKGSWHRRWIKAKKECGVTIGLLQTRIPTENGKPASQNLQL